jgi:hypothetical protein
MTRYKEFRVTAPLQGLAADPDPEEVQVGEWHILDQFHNLNRRIVKYMGWERFCWTGTYPYGAGIGEELI